MARQMKDSGIEWIGEIPNDWAVVPLQYHADLNTESLGEDTASDYEFDYVEIGSVTLEGGINEYEHVRFADAPSRARRVVKENDIIVSTVRTYLKAIAIVHAHENVIVSTGFAVLTPKDIDVGFLGFFLKSEYFVNMVTANSVGISYPAINASDLVKFKILLPSIEEQHRIADFLDRKCAEIDAVIERTKATIEEYKKLKQAVITEAVTKGVRGPRPMKNSGIEWIGDIPEEWNIARVGRLCFVTKLAGFEFTDHMMQALSEEGDVPIVRAQHIKMGRFLDNPTEYISFAVSQKLSRCALDQKCLIITFIGAGIGEVALFDKEQRYHLAPNVAKIVVTQEMQQYISEEYLLYFLMSSAGQEEVNKIKKATAQPSLSMETIRSIKILIPESKDEQAEIAAHLDKQCAALDTLIAKKTALLTELETYKKSLIYEYVTGKKEVE